MAQQKIQHIQEDFAAAFDVALARLKVRVDTACVGEEEWPRRVAAGIRACFAFAAERPADARVLTTEALVGGEESQLLYQRMISHFADLLLPGRDLNADSRDLPAITESAMAGGVALLIARRLDRGLGDELPTVAVEAVEFVLIPYVGIEEARRLSGRRPA